jgi:hypothetical protein
VTNSHCSLVLLPGSDDHSIRLSYLAYGWLSLHLIFLRMNCSIDYGVLIHGYGVHGTITGFGSLSVYVFVYFCLFFFFSLFFLTSLIRASLPECVDKSQVTLGGYVISLS